MSRKIILSLARSSLAGIGVIGVEELAVEVPHREPVGLRIDINVGIRLAQTQRIEVGDQVAADPVHVDALVHRDLFGHCLVAGAGGAIGVEVDGLVRNTDGLEDLVVEVVFADQQAVNGPQEFAGLGALDDAMVVGAGDGDDLGDAQIGHGARVGSLPRRWQGD